MGTNPEHRTKSSIPPATKRGVAPPASTPDPAAPEPAAAEPAPAPVIDPVDIVRRPPVPGPRRSVVDMGPVKGKSATARLAIAIPDPPAKIGQLPPAPPPMMTTAPSAQTNGGTTPSPEADDATTQPLTQTLPLTPTPPRPRSTPPPLPVRSSPPLSLPNPGEVSSRVVAAAEPAPEVPAVVPATPPSASKRPGRALPVVVTVAIVGLGAVIAYLRAQPAANSRDVASVDHLPVSSEPTPLPVASSTIAVTPTAVAALAVPEPTATAPPAPTTVASAPATTEHADESGGALAEDMGRIRTTGAISGRRIFVDDKTLGQTPASVVVHCGRHTVRLGSAGKSTTLDVPCRGEVTFTGR
jgi:serine/threonine-protein kinase